MEIAPPLARAREPVGKDRVQLDRELWRSDFRVVDSVMHPEASASTAESWMVRHGEPGAFPATTVPAV